MRAAWTLLATLLATPALAQTVTERLQTCVACHGQTGTSEVENVPSLGAMPVNYTLTQLYLFREKIRLADPMNAMAEGLTDDDLRSLGATFNAMPPPTPAAELPAAEREAGQALVEKYHCGSCHMPNLAGQQTIPHIAGQREDYLQRSLVAYKANTRKGYSPAMNEASQEIQDEDIPVLARYIASFRESTAN
jgi:cytochrome c553